MTLCQNAPPTCQRQRFTDEGWEGILDAPTLFDAGDIANPLRHGGSILTCNTAIVGVASNGQTFPLLNSEVAELGRALLALGPSVADAGLGCEVLCAETVPGYGPTPVRPAPSSCVLNTVAGEEAYTCTWPWADCSDPLAGNLYPL